MKAASPPPASGADDLGRPTKVKRALLVVTFDFPPSLEVGAHACSQLARYLPDYGWEPVVLTVDERYLTNRDPKEQRSFPGVIVRTAALPHPLQVWRRVRRLQRGAGEGVDVDGNLAGKGGRTRRWVLSILKTPDIFTGWLPIAVVQGIREVRRRDVRHIFSSAPYWTNHLVALCIAAATGRPWTAHFRDPWIGIPQWKPVSRLSMAIEERMEHLVVTRATSIVCVTEEHATLLRERYPELPPEKFTIVTNGFDEGEWEDLPPLGTGPGERRAFVLTYAGSFYQARNPLPVFQALRRLIAAGELTEQAVRVELIGWCDVAEGALVREAARTVGLEDVVHFVGALSRQETLPRLLESDLLLLLAEAQPYQIPGKTYEYLRAGRPILALTRAGAVAQLLRGLPGAHVVDPDDIAGIAAAVRDVYGHWREGRTGPLPARDFVTQFDRRRLAGLLADVFERATPSTAPAPE
ncbi:MAG TPA: glycosyltransferase [Methylomirabilota bacterium]|jgi:glycosyltransferase involved in cell wall biosynthesis